MKFYRTICQEAAAIYLRNSNAMKIEFDSECNINAQWEKPAQS